MTGGAGFIGSHIVDHYLTAGWAVGVIDNFSTGLEANLAGKNIQLYRVDITDQSALTTAFADFQPTHLSHQAAQVSVRRSLIDPVFDAKVNIVGTINLIELAKRHKIKQFIFASSGGAIYGDSPERVPAAEDNELQPQSPYGLSKLAAEQYLGQAAKQGLPITILRYANAYGPRQGAAGEAGVIPIFLERWQKQLPAIIYGDGEQARDFVCVDDIVAAHALVTEQAAFHCFNIGSGQTTTVNQLHQFMATAWQTKTGQAVLPAEHQAPIAGEVRWSGLNMKKISDRLGWRPLTGLSAGLEKTVTWFLGHVAGK